jgi:hypothetical protein
VGLAVGRFPSRPPRCRHDRQAAHRCVQGEAWWQPRALFRRRHCEVLVEVTNLTVLALHRAVRVDSDDSAYSACVHRLYFRQVEDLVNAGERFDVISLSNVYDWAPLEVSAVSLRRVVDHYLAPGGYVVVRRATGRIHDLMKGAGMLEDAEDADFSSGLAALDANPFFFNKVDCLCAARFSGSA